MGTRPRTTRFFPKWEDKVRPESPSYSEGCGMRPRFCILKVLGDVLDDGESVFLGAAETLELARRRAEALAEFWQGEYVIYDELTGNRVSIVTPTKDDRSTGKNFRKAS